MPKNTFNPDPFRGNVDAPSFLGASRGRSAVAAKKTQADTSGAAVQSDVDFDQGQTAQKSAALGLSLFKVVDEGIQRKQQTNLQAKIDIIDNEFGVSDRTDLDVEAGTATPAQIGTAGKELERLAKAQASGQLRDSHYWARVNSVVRQMRAKFPAYRDQIDT